MEGKAFRLYNDLAWLWPLWNYPTDPGYVQWAENVTRLIRQYSKIPAKSLLNMACGGGTNAYNLKKHFEVTGVDISRPMLDLAKALNPDCEFVLADMRTCSLGRQFDAVFADDGITEISDRSDLAAVFQTAFEHLRPGGVLIVGPDFVKETFQQNLTTVSEADGPEKPANLEVTFVENDYDPDPADDTYEFTLIYVIRENGVLRIETDHSVDGLFSLDTWRTMLSDAGFKVHEETNAGASEGDPRSATPVFVCIRPEGSEI